MVRISERQISLRLTQKRVHYKIKNSNTSITKNYGFKSFSCIKEKLFNEIFKKINVILNYLKTMFQFIFIYLKKLWDRSVVHLLLNNRIMKL